MRKHSFQCSLFLLSSHFGFISQAPAYRMDVVQKRTILLNSTSYFSSSPKILQSLDLYGP